MIMIGTITFPEERANDVAKCYMTLPPVPDFIQTLGTYVYNNPGEKIRAFAIFQFDEGRANEALEYFKLRYEVFGRVEGLTSKAEEWLDVQDALKIVEEGEYNINTLSSGGF
ncbi:MAG: hypothetical protein ACOZF0_21390 [Thermodesulfobacteriota bacterium]